MIGSAPPRATIGGVVLPFCAMNASGTCAAVGELIALARSATGAVVMRPTTVHPFLHPEFRALHNPGYDRYLPLVTELKAFGKPVIASIAGASADEYVTLAAAFGEAGADLIEVNIADPYVSATMAPWETPIVLVEMLAAVRAAAGRPILVKCPEHMPLTPADLRRILNDAGADAVSLANTFETMEKFLLETGRSGPCVVAVGGVSSGFDLASALHKGATAVQARSVLAREGVRFFARLAREYDTMVHRR